MKVHPRTVAPLFVSLVMFAACAAAVLVAPVAVSAAAPMRAPADGTAAADEITLWPEIEPFKAAYLRVSDLHEIYYELCGNPRGRPVFVLHGGPGASSIPYYRRFFNPDTFLIVLHDQRGCGRSKPFAELRENTTQNLVSDIEKLREELGLGKIILFGGSWGSTLALAYAETYPGNTAGIVLRGVFTATQREIAHYYYGGVGDFFPEAYNRLLSTLPDSVSGLSPRVLFDLIRSGDDEARKKYSVAWIDYEATIAQIEATSESFAGRWDGSELMRYIIYSLALIENYYMANNCFLEEGQLLRDAHTLAGIPTIIVNGRYDMICPPVNAYRVHRSIPGSKLVIAEMAGHSMSQKPVERALLEAMREFEGAAH
jgi:proline iminopeptidase